MRAVEILQKLITYPTITPQECGIYGYIADLLQGFEMVRFDKGEVKNVFFYKVVGGDVVRRAGSGGDSVEKCAGGQAQNQARKQGENQAEAQLMTDLARLKDLPHLCFAGHIDVVPTGEGWREDPFCGSLRDGIVYGRGAQDMKAGVAGFVAALEGLGGIMERALEDSKARLVSVLLTSDEEGVGIDGTRHVLEELEKIGLLPDFAIVAEPTSSEVFGDMIKIGRRGSINGILQILGKQGHVAYPEKCVNPVEILGERLGALAGHLLDEGDGDFAPSKLVITDIRGGIEAVNVTPQALKIMFNVRNNTLTTKEDIQSYVSGVLEGVEHTLELKQSSYPFKTPASGWLAQNLSSSIHEIAGIRPTFSTSGGTSDARFFAHYGVEVAEFGVKNDKIHSVDESVEAWEVEKLALVFSDILERFLRS